MGNRERMTIMNHKLFIFLIFCGISSAKDKSEAKNLSQLKKLTASVVLDVMVNIHRMSKLTI